MPKLEIWLMRHGETAWSRTGQHTGGADIALTPEGEQQARALGAALKGQKFDRVFSSPLRRAQRTCELAGFAAEAVLTADLREWNYGRYEGLTSEDIQRERPGWSIWDEGPAGGETIEEVAARAARVIEAVLEPGAGREGRVALFAHGHILRVLTATWLGLEPRGARYFALSTGSISVLGYERETRVIRSWNAVPSPVPSPE